MSRLRRAALVLTASARTALICFVAFAGCLATVNAGPPPKVTDLGGFVGYYTTARGINDAGEIVGETYRTIDPDMDTRESFGWLWRKNAQGTYVAAELRKLDEFPNSYPRSINSSGQIAGWAEVATFEWTPPSQAVLWQKEALGAHVPSDLGTPSGFCYSQTATFSEGGHVLNETGQVVGSAMPPPCCTLLHAYLWTGTGAPAIDVSASAGEAEGKAYGVNNAGVVVGSTASSSTEYRKKAALWRPDGTGGYLEEQLPTPSGSQSATAFDINDGGRIVGIAGSRAVVWERTPSGDYQPSFLDLLPGGTYSRALAVNNAGDVVGWVIAPTDGGTFRHAVAWRSDSLGRLVPEDLGTLPGFTSSDAYGINERGQIVGSASYFDASTQTTVQHAVLWDLSVDTTPPTITGASADPGVLWPPNHKMVTVTVSYDVTDDSDSPTCILGPVTCNELLAEADWDVLDAHHVLLKSERDGEGSGRAYLIPITCTDPSGNSASAATIVMVPHDRRR